MVRYIDKDALIAMIKRHIKEEPHSYFCKCLLSEIDTIEVKEVGVDLGDPKGDKSAKYIIDTKTLKVKEVDLDLITGWFDHVAQIADDRMTLTNQRMTDAHALDEIKCLAKNSSEFITKHYKTQKGEEV